MFEIKFTVDDLIESSQEEDKSDINKKEEADKANERLKEAVEQLGSMIYQHITDLADKELKSSKAKYMEHLKLEQIDEYTCIISLAPEAMWIEDGIQPNFQMLPGLLKNAKTDSKGVRYVNIPLEKMGTNAAGPQAGEMSAIVRSEMENRGIPVEALELNEDGTPKEGRLHRFDIDQGPVSKNTGLRLLQGVNVVQRYNKEKKAVEKSILTFRRATSNQDPSKFWVHPGTQARNFFDHTEQWLLSSWDAIMSNIAPDGGIKVDFNGSTKGD